MGVTGHRLVVRLGKPTMPHRSTSPLPHGTPGERQAPRGTVPDHVAPTNALIAVDAFGRLTGWSSHAEQLLGWTTAEALGQRLAELVPVTQADAPASWPLDNGEAVEPLAVRLRDGRDLPVRVTATVLRGDSWELTGIVYSVCTEADATRLQVAERSERAARAEVKRLAARLDTVSDAERTRLAQDLHDELGQLLTGLKFDLSALQRAVAARRLQGNELHAHITAAAELVEETMKASRRLTLQLRPKLLEELGLSAALEWLAEELCRRRGIGCTVHCQLPPGGERRKRERAESAAFRITQEALTNVVRHASARHVTVEVSIAEGAIVLSVGDDGRGIPAGPRRQGAMGIAGMRDRARACGGTLLVRRRSGGGTQVQARLPAQR
jgi:two-component system sensor histidine kinase UhpB